MASVLRFGSAVKSPLTSPSMANKSASIRLATNAERLSLSPNASIANSSTATTSFSLTIGTILLEGDSFSVDVKEDYTRVKELMLTDEIRKLY